MSSPEQLIAGSVELLTLPEVYFQAKSVLEDPDAGLDHFANVIAYDPGLSARFLKLANSPVFGFVSRIETVSRAVAVMGMQQAYDIVLATAVARTFGGISTKIIDLQAFWRRSVYCAIVSRLLADRCDVLDSERLFVEGLLRDLGHLLLYLKKPGKVRQAVQKSQESGLPLSMVEREILGFDYAELGAALLGHWGLPPSLQVAVRYHPTPSAAPEFLLETSILHIAALVTDAAESQETPDLSALPIEASAWKVTGLAPEDVDAACREVSGQLAEVLNAFFPRGRAQSTPTKVASPGGGMAAAG